MEQLQNNSEPKTSKLRISLKRKLLGYYRLAVATLQSTILEKKHKIFYPEANQFQELPKDPLSKFLRQSVTAAVALLLVTSFSPDPLLDVGASAQLLEEIDGTDDLATEESAGLFMMDDLFLLKENSVKEEDVSYIGVNEIVRYTVVEGETLSDIATRHGLKTDTLVYANGLGRPDALQIGQTLIIPPMDGVFYVVRQGDTLNSIAKLHKVESDVIKNHNKADALKKGQKVFIPGGKALPQAPVIARGGVRQGRVAVNTFDLRPPTIVTNGGTNGKLIWPTDGKISRGFVGGHYALDIANRSKPDVWAAKSGVVVKAAGGCPIREAGRFLGCNSGYGNHVIIDHGNGLQTLYAHLETIFVSDGTSVEAGQLIGKMGNTGRSYGATGIHLHFEVIDNGVKRNGMKYF